ncbi:glycosyl hydrolase [Arthrobacter ginkgonis]
MPKPSPTRRQLIGTAAIAGLGLAVWPSADQAAHGAPDQSPASDEAFARSFRKPPNTAAARFRWWWPNGHVEPIQIRREVAAIAKAGFGGLEIADVHHSVRSGLDPVGHGWATPAWKAGLEAALEEAVEQGVTIDVTAGPSWPSALPTVTPDDPAAVTELAHGTLELAGGSTYDGVVPAALHAAADGVTKQQLIAVQAVRIVTRSTRESTLEKSSLVDLTDQVVDGRLRWAAPDGEWLVLAYWQRGSGQMPEAGPHTSPDSYVVDHFSRLGTEAITGYWDRNILTPKIRRLLRTAGNTFFEDSLEMETESTLWTAGFLDEFRAQNGYDLLPYLPVVIESKEKYLYTYATDETSRVRDDVAQVFSNLYRDNHLLPLKKWANALGLELRIQAYGLETDTLEYSGLLDQPETESLGFKNLDDYRIMAGGRDMGGRTILSCEAAAYNGSAYAVPWSRVLTTVNSIYTAGVNQAVLHGFPYADAPGAQWPGFAAFSPYFNNAPGFSEAWGPRQPTWGHVPHIADYLRRTQWVLQSGRPRLDLVYYRQKGWASTGIGVQWGTNDGIPVGWSHGFLSAALLDWESAIVRNGRLAPDGPAYKAIIIEADAFRGRRPTLTVRAAERLYQLAADGLAVIFVGDWNNATVEGLPQGTDNVDIKKWMDRSLALPTVRLAGTATELPALLAELGIEREVAHEKSTLIHMHRALDDADLYYIANAKHAENRRLERVEQDIWIRSDKASDVPYRLDAWTGEINRVGQFTRDEGGIRVRVALDPGESTIIAVAAATWNRKRDAKLPQVLHTDADSVSVDGQSVSLRAASGGKYLASLAGGTTRTFTIPEVPAPATLRRWSVEIEDWQPGSVATETAKSRRSIELEELKPWSELPGFEDTSGLGVYRTTLRLDQRWSHGVGSYLKLGEVFDTFRVKVNGTELQAPASLQTVVDLGTALHPGENTIEIEVATTLLNRLRVSNPTVFGVAGRQRYGLIGPVELVPYGTVEVR